MKKYITGIQFALVILLIASNVFAGRNVLNYFTNPNSGSKDNILVIGGTQNVSGTLNVTGTLASSTLNTGQGANELYAMDQDVKTTDAVTFDDIAITNAFNIGYVAASDSTTVTASSATVVNCTKAGAMSVTLPTAVGNEGLYFIIKKTGSAGAITITTNSTETIDGTDDPTYVDAQYDYIGIVSDGANWIIVNRYVQ